MGNRPREDRTRVVKPWEGQSRHGRLSAVPAAAPPAPGAPGPRPHTAPVTHNTRACLGGRGSRRLGA